MWGFDLKSLIEIILMPCVLFVLGIWLPGHIEKSKSRQRKKEFEKLICREMEEMKPYEPENQAEPAVWTDYLRKRFIHEDIFRQPSENRDFILSLDPDLAYREAQLWMSFDKAVRTRCDGPEEKKKVTLTENELSDMGEYGAQWCIHLANVVEHFEPECATLRTELYSPWETLIVEHHPAVAGKINKAREELAHAKSMKQ